jgi:hypothetical protein
MKHDSLRKVRVGQASMVAYGPLIAGLTAWTLLSRRSTAAALFNIAQTLISASWYARVTSRCMMFAENRSWEEWYLQTILEVNGEKMPKRISATRQAIAGRLRDLEHDSDHHAERHQIENALRALAELEVETQRW